VPLYRCLHCKAEFDAPRPACAACGLDPAKDPRDASQFAEMAVVHFDPPSHVEGRGKGFAACDPKVRYGGDRRFTGEPAAVTCPACKTSEALAAAGSAHNGVLNMPVQNLKGG
jgi:hypothetical protein